MPAMGSAPPTIRGIVFVLFVMFLLIAIPAAALVWLIVILPWQATIAAFVGYLIGYRIGNKTT